MSLNDPLANLLSHILLEERNGKPKIAVDYSSTVIKAVLTLLRNNQYIGEFIEDENKKGNSLTINLIGAINKIGVIKPRYSVKLEEYAKFEKRFLPTYGFGFLVVSTNQGIMTHEEAIKKHLGGRLLAFVY